MAGVSFTVPSGGKDRVDMRFPCTPGSYYRDNQRQLNTQRTLAQYTQQMRYWIKGK